jgi:hypothetical protein
LGRYQYWSDDIAAHFQPNIVSTPSITTIAAEHNEAPPQTIIDTLSNDSNPNNQSWHQQGINVWEPGHLNFAQNLLEYLHNNIVPRIQQTTLEDFNSQYPLLDQTNEVAHFQQTFQRPYPATLNESHPNPNEQTAAVDQQYQFPPNLSPSEPSTISLFNHENIGAFRYS